MILHTLLQNTNLGPENLPHIDILIGAHRCELPPLAEVDECTSHRPNGFHVSFLETTFLLTVGLLCTLTSPVQTSQTLYTHTYFCR